MALKESLLWLSERPNVFEFIKSNAVARKMASRFVAGETLDSAIKAVKDINENDLTASLDLLGESVSNRDEAFAAKQQIIEVLDRIQDSGVNANVSMKLTQLGMDIDENLCADNMFALLEHAQRSNSFVRIDMESSAYTELTLKLFRERFFPEFGEWRDFFGTLPYNPASSFFGGKYTLTTRAGNQYVYDGPSSALETISDRNGNTLRITSSGIFSTTGKLIRLERDPQARFRLNRG